MISSRARPCLLVVSLLAWTGCRSAELPAPAPAHVLPFERNEHDNILVRAVLNGEDEVLLMLHTAVDSLSMTTDSLARAKSVEV